MTMKRAVRYTATMAECVVTIGYRPSTLGGRGSGRTYECAQWCVGHR